MRFRKLKQQKTHINTPQTQEKKKYLAASHPLKIKAFVTDMFMIYIPILYVLTYLVLDGKDAFMGSELAPFVGVALYGLIYAFLLSRYAQTPGKRAYGLEVRNASNGEKISFLRALLRFVAFLVGATLLFGLLLPYFRRDKKALHDLIAGTIEVVEKERL